MSRYLREEERYVRYDRSPHRRGRERDGPTYLDPSSRHRSRSRHRRNSPSYSSESSDYTDEEYVVEGGRSGRGHRSRSRDRRVYKYSSHHHRSASGSPSRRRRSRGSSPHLTYADLEAERRAIELENLKRSKEVRAAEDDLRRKIEKEDREKKEQEERIREKIREEERKAADEKKRREEEKKEIERLAVEKYEREKDKKKKEEAAKEKEFKERMENDLLKRGYSAHEIREIMKDPSSHHHHHPESEGVGGHGGPQVKMARRFISIETLRAFNLPYFIPANDQDTVIVTRVVNQREADIYFDHTRRLREARFAAQARDQEIRRRIIIRQQSDEKQKKKRKSFGFFG